MQCCQKKYCNRLLQKALVGELSLLGVQRQEVTCITCRQAKTIMKPSFYDPRILAKHWCETKLYTFLLSWLKGAFLPANCTEILLSKIPSAQPNGASKKTWGVTFLVTLWPWSLRTFQGHWPWRNLVEHPRIVVYVYIYIYRKLIYVNIHKICE